MEVLDPCFIRSSLCDPRPSMVPIALDIIDLVTFPRKLLPTGPSKELMNGRQAFGRTPNSLDTVKEVRNEINVYSPSELKRVIRYLVDILKNVTSLLDDDHWEVLGRKFHEAQFFLCDPPSTISSSLTPIFLNDFTTDFICSGPFRVILTDDIRQHLRLTEKYEIPLFLHFEKFLSMYNSHS